MSAYKFCESKSLFLSKAFWFNIISLAVMAASNGLIPEKYAVPVLTVGNVLIRLFSTSGPTHIIPPV